ncbi:MAG TPA: sialidase family protein, partial [Candidatus Kapabacteria bacterium]|nr:sialidase family protein [Candidatus Kapabacteria bacterium]
MKRPFLLTFLLFLLTLVFFAQIGSAQIARDQEREDPKVERDNANARAQYELLRQHDPATGEIPNGIRAQELAFASHLPVRAHGISLTQPGFKNGATTLTSTQWNLRGPYNIGGRTRALAIDVSNPNVILAGGVSGGMWRSSDTGSTWVKTTADDDLLSVTCVAQDTRPGKTNVWYYGTGEFAGSSANAVGANYFGNGIFKSTDDGQTWNILPSTDPGNPKIFDQPFDYVFNIVPDPYNMSFDILYAATVDGIHRSTNGGATWSTVLGKDTSNSAYTDVAVTHTGVIYAALSTNGRGVGTAPINGIYRSTDGISWTNITPAGWPGYTGAISIALAPSNENSLYVIANTGGAGPSGHAFWKYSYISGDGSGSGGTWTDRSSNLPNTPFFNQNFIFDSQNGYDLYVHVKPDNENIVYIGGIELYRSTDGLSSTLHTQMVGSELTNNFHVDQHALAFSPTNPGVMFAGNDGGVFETQNDLASTMQWRSLNNGYYTTQFYTAALDHANAGNPIIIGGMQDNGTIFTGSVNATNPWSNLLSGDGSYCAIANGRSAYYMSYQNGVIYRTYVDDSGSVSTPSFARLDPLNGTGY